jgi:hypothetical protein
MSRKITLNIKGGNSKQYSTLVIELNLIAKAWGKFGVDITLPGQERIIEWGKRKHNDHVGTKTNN